MGGHANLVGHTDIPGHSSDARIWMVDTALWTLDYER